MRLVSSSMSTSPPTPFTQSINLPLRVAVCIDLCCSVHVLMASPVTVGLTCMLMAATVGLTCMLMASPATVGF